MLDFITAAELRIFIFESVEAVRALGDDAVEFDLAHGFQILLSEDLEQILITHPAGSLTTTGLVKTQEPEIHIGFLQQVDERSGDFLVAVIKG